MSHSDNLGYEKKQELNQLSTEEDFARDEAYFKRYNLEMGEYQQKWYPIRRTIFDMQARWFPDMLFQPGFEFIYGPPPHPETITRYELIKLKECMHALGEKEFVIIENEPFVEAITCKKYRYTPSKLRFPSTISYPELLDGGDSALLIIDNYFGTGDYFIFSESGQWGVYAPADDCIEDTVIFIIGFRKEAEPLFTEIFKDYTTKEEKRYILEKCLPPAYQSYDKHLLSSCKKSPPYS